MNSSPKKNQVYQNDKIHSKLYSIEDRWVILKPDIERVLKMESINEELVSSEIFSDEEKSIFESSYSSMKQRVVEILEVLVLDLDECKLMWQEKQQQMKLLYEKGYLTDEVCEYWSNSLENCASWIQTLEDCLNQPFSTTPTEEVQVQEESRKEKKKHRHDKKSKKSKKDKKR